MKSSKKVYIAPDLFFAFINRAHTKHEQAAAFFRFFASENYQLYTDLLSIEETYNQIYTLISPSLARDFLRTLLISNLNIIYPDENDTKAAVKTLSNYQSGDITYQKALLTTLAYRRGIQQVATFEYLPNLFGLSMFYLPI